MSVLERLPVTEDQDAIKVSVQMEEKEGERTVELSKIQDLEKIQQVISLVLNQSDIRGDRVIHLRAKDGTSEAMYVKPDAFESDDDSGGVSEILQVETDKDNSLSRQAVEDETVAGVGEDGAYLTSEPTEYQILKDHNSRMHYVKFVKVDNKTVKIWECGICGKEFRHQYTLMRHLPTHTDERNFKCDSCGKAFRQMSTLSQHRAIHSDARPYVCELCKKTFNRVSTLISHRKTHSEHKPHKCTVCGKGFHQKGNLRNHVFTHTNERPYKCELCGKGFNQMSNLMCHKTHSHGTKTPFVCSICNVEFPRKYALRSHEEYKHGIKYRDGVKIQEMDPSTFRDIVSRKQKRREEKNLRIIHLPNGDRTLADINNLISTQYRQGKGKGNFRVNSSDEKAPSAGVLIDPINTRAMFAAKRDGQTPFALLKPAKGIPVLVKVMPAANNKQMLVPATAEDLKSAGKITVSSPNCSSSNGSVKAVQIKVPVVATVIQRANADGQLTIEVEPPGPEQDLSAEPEPTTTTEMPESEDRALFLPPAVPCLRPEGTILCEEDVDEPDAPMEFLDGSEETAKGLLELAATGGIQFVKPLGDGAFEVLSHAEAAEIMQLPGQTLGIVNEDQQESEPDSADALVNHNNLSALVDAIRAAGYQVTEGQKQIVITPSESEINDDETGSAVQHIVYAEPEEVMLNAEQNGANLVIEPTEAPIHFILEETGEGITYYAADD